MQVDLGTNNIMDKTASYGDSPAAIMEQEESLKIIKNTKGYNWEIKIFPKKDQSDKEWLDRLSYIDEECKQRFGGDI